MQCTQIIKLHSSYIVNTSTVAWRCSDIIVINYDGRHRVATSITWKLYVLASRCYNEFAFNDQIVIPVGQYCLPQIDQEFLLSLCLFVISLASSHQCCFGHFERFRCLTISHLCLIYCCNSQGHCISIPVVSGRLPYILPRHILQLININ